MYLVTRLAAMYRDDPALALALARARGLCEEPGMAAMAQGAMGGGARAAAVALATKAADFLQRSSQVAAVLELDGSSGIKGYRVGRFLERWEEYITRPCTSRRRFPSRCDALQTARPMIFCKRAAELAAR